MTGSISDVKKQSNDISLWRICRHKSFPNATKAVSPLGIEEVCLINLVFAIYSEAKGKLFFVDCSDTCKQHDFRLSMILRNYKTSLNKLCRKTNSKIVAKLQSVGDSKITENDKQDRSPKMSAINCEQVGKRYFQIILSRYFQYLYCEHRGKFENSVVPMMIWKGQSFISENAVPLIISDYIKYRKRCCYQYKPCKSEWAKDWRYH